MKWEEKHVNLLKDYKKKIDDIAVSDLNKDQKELSKMILDNLKDPLQLQNVFQFLMNRIKIGFTFDVAPEVNKKEIALLKFNKKLSFNNNENGAKNQLIIGENYDALKNLLVVQKEKYKEHAIANYDVIYIDPPYNTESAFSDGNCVADDKEKVNAKKFIYRDKFSRNGWLNMMNERLQLARKLLKEDGVIFVSIDDSEQAYLKVLMDEIFGEKNFVANLTWIKKRGPGGNTSINNSIVKNTEFILVYAKNLEIKNFNYLTHDQETLKKLGYVNKDKYFDERGPYKLTLLFRPSSNGSFQYTKTLDYPIIAPDGSEFYLHVNKIKPQSGCYTWGYETYQEGNRQGFIECHKNNDGDWVAYRKQYANVKFDPKSRTIIKIAAGQEYQNFIDDFYSSNGGEDIKNIFNDKNKFDFPKPMQLIKYLINMASPNKNAKILDFFAGSGTTGHAVMELNKEDGGNRSFTLVTNNENNIALNVTYERLYRINKGIGTNNESFKWAEKNEPYKQNLSVFDIKYSSIDLSQDENQLLSLKETLRESLKEFGVNSFNDEDLLLNLERLYALGK
ncbi:site-specific DNA-methyltransferase [Mycoplasma sp. M5725]|uniref:Site-specific DNA-methyltransferase n=1 Tax=Mycoplasma phocimorsus TaxID=3045839 RepID=A0AAJ1PQP9_9MOLU|nr:site-specific DNA-methyltransferase [Mycoplasma phocimorsus]MDJ1645587.1 site-specific DNA-methyltransferase [Mycoplasma phocimorsus]